MFKFFHKKKALATIEYITLMVILLGVFVVFNTYIIRAMSGRWKSVGEGFDQFRQYDPKATTRCAYDPNFTNRWYNADCYEKRCDCHTVRATNMTCDDCIRTTCGTPYCD